MVLPGLSAAVISSLFAVAFFCACGVPSQGVAGDAGTIDRSAAGLTQFVKAGGYLSWRAETAVHSSSGPHGGNVRSYLNEVLYASLKAGNATHPPGSTVVKELYGSGGTAVTGHAVDLKDESGSWTFYEGFAPSYASPYYFQGSSNLCANCHQAGVDHYLGLLSNLP